MEFKNKQIIRELHEFEKRCAEREGRPIPRFKINGSIRFNTDMRKQPEEEREIGIGRIPC